jgi:hypothetical protein
MELTAVEQRLYRAGFIRTQPGFYETPLAKDLFVFCEEGSDKVSLQRSTEDSVEVLCETTLSEVKQDYSLINAFR